MIGIYSQTFCTIRSTKTYTAVKKESDSFHSINLMIKPFIFYFSHILQRCYSLSDTQIEVFLRHLSNFAQDSGSSATRIEITRYLYYIPVI